MAEKTPAKVGLIQDKAANADLAAAKAGETGAKTKAGASANPRAGRRHLPRRARGGYGTSGGYGWYGNPGGDMGTYGGGYQGSGQGYGGGMGAYGQTGRQREWREREYPGGGVGGYRGEREGGYDTSGGYSGYGNPSGDTGAYGGGYQGARQGYGGGMGAYGQPGRYTGRGPKGWRRSDERILEDVNERLTQHPDIDAFEIEIEVKNGEVLLRGSVGDRHEKRMAEDVAENVSGVRNVRNELRVQPAEHAATGSSTGGSQTTGTSSHGASGTGSSYSGSSSGSQGTSGSSKKS